MRRRLAVLLTVVLAGMLMAAAAAAGSDIPESLEALRQRRQALAEQLPENAVAVLFGARDSDGPFVQQPDFLYLTGLDLPDAAVLLDPADQRRPETLFLPARDRAAERWTGERPGPGDVDPETGAPNAERLRSMGLTGFGALAPRSSLEVRLGRLAGEGRRLGLLLPAPALDEPLTPELMLVERLRKRHPGLLTVDLRTPLRELRMNKSTSELRRMRQAAAITIAAHRRLAADVAPGMFEYQAQAVVEYVFRDCGSERPAFPSILGSGPNATVLHYDANRREMLFGELLVADVGASYRGYAADITRTYPVGGRFNRRQRELYELVLKAQQAAMDEVKPGARLRSDVHAAAVEVLEQAGYGQYYPHGTSHSVGLEAHDPMQRDQRLRPGMVITVEPGLYIPSERLGIRVEDMVLVTESGYELLTAELPREADAIEALMAAEAEPVLQPCYRPGAPSRVSSARSRSTSP
jgi:Xaa-Pro aminopeptidase